MITEVNVCIDRNEIPVKLSQRDGTVIEGKLVEMDGETRDQYLDLLNNNTKTSPQTGKPTGVKSMRGLHAQLIMRCLVLADNTHPNLPTIQKYSSTAQKALYDACVELNGLDKDAENRAKNESEASGEDGTDSPTG